MAVSVSTSIRVPKELLGDARKAVENGYYTSVNELIVAGLRREVYKFEESRVAREVREFREQMWEKMLKKAGGDSRKAADFYVDEIRKFAENDELIKKAKAMGLYRL